jgi:serine protease Do
MLKRARRIAAVFVLLCFSGAATALAATPSVALPDFTSIVKKYGPAVVYVVARYNHASEMGGDSPMEQTQQPPVPDIFRFFGMPFGPQFRQPPDRGGESLGSGFIISSDGYILTNRHVVAHADSVKVHLPDHRTYTAKVVGEDKIYDIALLKIDANNLPAVQIGNSSDLEPGQWVVAIGSPFGLDHSVSAGIVSYVGRSLGDQEDVPFIQTDVPINRGNSGGPLFNLSGQVVGINSQIFSTDGGSMGLSFSIPINLAMDAVHQLKTRGYVSRGMLGVTVQRISEGIAKSKGLAQAQGALIAQVQPNSPAQKAGLEVGDVITGFDGHKIYDSSELPPVVAMTAPGSEANVSILRNGKPMTIKVKVGEMPRNGLSPEYLANGPAATSGSSLLGLTVQDITPQIRQQLGGYTGKGGVVITDVKGPAARAGLSPGDVILRVGNKPVNSVSEFRRDTASVKAGSTVLLLVSHQGQNLFMAISVPAK